MLRRDWSYVKPAAAEAPLSEILEMARMLHHLRTKVEQLIPWTFNFQLLTGRQPHFLNVGEPVIKRR